MPDMEIRDLSSLAIALTHCPALIYGHDEVRECGQPLRVTLTTTVRGDDYGSWRVHDVHFWCGHSFEEMAASFDHDV